MKLQFTNGYRPRFDQISRILLFLSSQGDKKKISRREIVAALGIPEKQVENLTSMMTGFGLVRPRVTTLTLFGKAIIQSDPYFDRLETLWIIHYLVSSNPEYLVWYRIINMVLPAQDFYSIDQVSSQYFSDINIHFSERTIKEKLPKEVGAVFAAYCRTELSRLNLLEDNGRGEFRKSNSVEIPDLAFLYCLIHYRDTHSPGSSALNIEEICTADYSLGRVLNLPEYQIRVILGNLHDTALIRLEQLANLDQVRFSDTLTRAFILNRIYEVKDA